jgi:two-component system, NtrC family, response regulator AtoC
METVYEVCGIGRGLTRACCFPANGFSLSVKRDPEGQKLDSSPNLLFERDRPSHQSRAKPVSVPCGGQEFATSRKKSGTFRGTNRRNSRIWWINPFITNDLATDVAATCHPVMERNVLSAYWRNMTIETMPVTTEPASKPLDFALERSASMKALKTMLAGLAQTNIPVLIVGESGTGKDVYAQRLHQLSLRSMDPFEKIGCASAENGQIREKLQHYLQGTNGTRPGTLFLDDVQELDPVMQKYLLALLDGPGLVLNLRIVSSAATCIERNVDTGHFRRELYFRLKGACLRLPPLRERREDIPALLEHFLIKHARELNRGSLAVGPADLEALAAYDWPGNVRELENLAIKFIAVGSTCVDPKDFLRATSRGDGTPGARYSSPLKVAARKALRRTERELILDALERTHWNRKKAAQDLQISYKSLLYKIKQIGAEQEENLRGERS